MATGRNKKQNKTEVSVEKLKALVRTWREWMAENDEEAAVDAIGDCVDSLNELIEESNGNGG